MKHWSSLGVIYLLAIRSWLDFFLIEIRATCEPLCQREMENRGIETFPRGNTKTATP